MKMLFCFLVAFSLLLNMSCSKKMQEISVSYMQPYCGGAKPTPEMVAEAEKVLPYSGKTFIVVSEKGKADSAKTNEKGVMKLKLSPGSYKVYESWKYYKSTPSGESSDQFNKTCLEEEWKKHFMDVTVTKTSVTQKSEGPIILTCPGRENCRTNKILPE
ncbi:MAG: hypothetical protein K0S12_2397 [Bacteroidetes bacterium]|jgi:hypothetical protein|nr:hypothetical protein [Bacteroidota bacterium]